MSTSILRSSKSRKALLSGAALAGITAMAPLAQATLTINLRFTDGSTTLTLTQAQNAGALDIPVQVWATVTGANALSASNFDGLGFVTYSVKSGAAGSGILVGSGNGLAAPGLNATWAASGSQLGQLQDLNADGVGDMGSSTTNSNTSFAKARNAGAVWSDDGTATKNTLANGVEFLVETVNYHISAGTVAPATNGKGVSFSASIPPWVTGLTKGANWWQDNATKASGTGTSNGAYSAGTSVVVLASAAPTTKIVSLTTAAPTGYNVQITSGNAAGDLATFNPSLPVADSINVTNNGIGSYLPGFANNINTGTGKATDYVKVSGFNASDPEIYALNIKVGGSDPSSGQINTIISDINGGNNVGLSASVVSGVYSTLFPGYDLLLTSTGSTAATDFLGFDFSQETNVAGVTVSDVAAIPEPTTAIGVMIGAAGMLLSRRRSRTA